MTAPCDLGGRGILVTRPAAQAEVLCALIRAAKGNPIPFPTLEIAPVADLSRPRTLLSQTWDLLVFVSRNAVESALALLDGTPGAGAWGQARMLAAVGRATAAALEAAGRAPDLVPAERFDSETLLALPELENLKGGRVLIVRGEGGRALMGEVLAARGAEVHYAEVYRRACPQTDPGDLLRRWPTEVHLLTATSDEVLLNLHQMLGPAGQPLALATPLVVISARTADTATRLGYRRVRVAQRAEDAAILESLCGLVRGEP
ncbi:MAG: uroporphyrinogen-III synthase [Bdellovibrio bacteriovorus]